MSITFDAPARAGTMVNSDTTKPFDLRDEMAKLSAACDVSMSYCEDRRGDPQKLLNLLRRRLDQLRLEVEQLYR